ncbi:flagellin [Desulfurispira natronophila]|uniref:Flagellin n=1 Tax=Desulfurispira natronophila TaxID=682562 RepID=A0A7W7Y4Q4_9BACT|nr:flagellin [Desulfurispira natronophila]MBB5022063.1 flagellin [Desulfurispira natronophila]
MSLQPYNHAHSLSSMNSLNIHQTPLKNALERISSGMRINRSSDDASGMAISEKMRSQIHGIDRAIRNSQDGISLIQTAEGALQETSAILQRMRELSVQASNGSLNSGDRQEIQREVDQLRDEIDRISTATEFNTKKLLNGDATAAWKSTDPDRINAVVRDRVATGNYRIDTMARVGQNQILKSNIMALQSGAFAGDILTNGTMLGDVANESGVVGVAAASELRTGMGDERMYKVNVAAASAGAEFVSGMPPEIFSVVGDIGSIMGYYQQPGSQFQVRGTEDTATTTLTTGETVMSSGINMTPGVHGYLEVEFLAGLHFEDEDNGDATVFPEGARVRFIDVKTGNRGEWAFAELNKNDAYLDLDTNSVRGWSTLTSGGQVPVGNIFDATDDEDNRLYFGHGDRVQAGDKMLLSLDAGMNLQGTMTIGAGALKVDERFVDGDIEREIRGAHYVTYTANGLQNMDLEDGNKYLDYYLPQLDETTGALNVGSITLDMRASVDGTMVDELVPVELRGEGQMVSTYTRLEDIEAFVTADGIDTFEHPQRITLYANSRRTDVVLNGHDTVRDMVDKFTHAITHKTDGLAINLDNVAINKHVADFVGRGEGVAESDNAVEGTLLLRSLFNGAQGAISMVADQKVIDSLNLHELQSAKENEYAVEVYDAHRGVQVGSALVADGTMSNVIAGVDVNIEGNIGVYASWNESERTISFEAGRQKTSTYLSIVDTALRFHVGPNDEHSVAMNISQMDARSLGVDNLVMISPESASSAIGSIEKALELVSTERSRLGAIGNRLDHTVDSLSVAEENLQSAESRIRDADIANEISTMTSKQVLSEAARAMLAQGNQLPRGLIQLLNN